MRRKTADSRRPPDPTGRRARRRRGNSCRIVIEITEVARQKLPTRREADVAIRIDGPGRSGGVQGNAPTRAKEGTGAAFTLPGGEAPAKPTAAALAGATALTDLASLLALQGVPVAEDRREKRRRAVRRGLDLLDVLEGVKIDLLGGGVAADRLERLVHLLGRRAPSGDERLDALIEEIELRSRVELAKFGRFPD